MQSNNQEQGAEVTACEMSGDGYTPDEHMQFSNSTTAAVLIKRAYGMMEEIQTRALTMECLLAKAIHLEHQWTTTDTDRPYGETLLEKQEICMMCPNCGNRQIEISPLSRGKVKGETQVKGCPECLHVWARNAEGYVKVIQHGYEPNIDIAA